MKTFALFAFIILIEIFTMSNVFASWQFENTITTGAESYFGSNSSLDLDFIADTDLSFIFSVTKWTTVIGSYAELDATTVGLSKKIDPFVSSDVNYTSSKIGGFISGSYELGLNVKLTDLLEGQIDEYGRDFYTNLNFSFSSGSLTLFSKTYTESFYSLGFEQTIMRDNVFGLNYAKYSYPQEADIIISRNNPENLFGALLWGLYGGFPSFTWDGHLKHTFNSGFDAGLFWMQQTSIIPTQVSNSYSLETNLYPRDFLKINLGYTLLSTLLYSDTTSYYSFGFGLAF
jgi:hypothetical protein